MQNMIINKKFKNDQSHHLFDAFSVTHDFERTFTTHVCANY